MNMRSVIMLLACGTLLLGAGCATTPELTREPIFYPDKPSEPRLQYLTSYTLSSDLAPKVGFFQQFVLGLSNEEHGGLIKPYGMAGYGSRLYVCDTIASQISVLDFEAKTWGAVRPKGGGSLQKPINVAVDEDERLYVTDALRGQVIISETDGTFVDGVGSKEQMKPAGVAVSKNRIYVGDLKGHRVAVYDRTSREFLFSFPGKEASNEEALFAPTNLTLDEDGNIYVSDTGACRIQKYDPEGNLLKTFGGPGSASGLFVRNKGIAVDREGRIYAVDAATQLAQIFDADGNLLLYFGEPDGSPVSMVLPAGITINYEMTDLFQPYADPNFKLEYLVFVSNQYGGRKVMVYGFGALINP